MEIWRTASAILPHTYRDFRIKLFRGTRLRTSYWIVSIVMRLRTMEKGIHSKRIIAPRVGLTLIEVLIATTLTLLMMLALAQGFKTMSDSITAGRARLTMADQLRGITGLLRNDLEGRTTNGSAPQSSLNANGYFMYYDGPLNDASALLFSFVSKSFKPAATVEQRLSASRWGDIDDVLMFTARAKQGEWFRGKIPRALMIIHNINSGFYDVANRPTLLPEDWYADISIASEFAEIAWFVRPLNENGSINIQELIAAGGGYPFTPPATPVIDAGGTDLDGDGILDPDGMPDKVALCRRVLLIRPDLQIGLGSNSAVGVIPVGTTDPQLSMQPLVPNTSSHDSFRYMMRFAYQRSDLSVRPILNSFGLTLATNSLADLQRPENRFSHYVLPVPNDVPKGILGATSMPILALTDEATSIGNYSSVFGRATESLGFGLSVSLLDRGFIPSAFFRTQVFPSSDPAVVGQVLPTMNEVIASNITAFDIKGFDPSAQLLANSGPDGGWGTAGVDDDGDGTVDNVSEYGWPGTDDVSLSPSDPGFAQALLAFGPNPVTAQSGAFVDLGWAWKTMNQRESYASVASTLGHPYFASFGGPPPSIWASSLSGMNPPGATPVPHMEMPTESLMKSGRVFVDGANNVLAFQPTFDTFTDAYESDSMYQAQFPRDANNLPLLPGNYKHIVWIGGQGRLLGVNYPTSFADHGNNGFDDNGDGNVDEDLERETSTPFPVSLPSIQVTVRIQDSQASLLQQLTVVQSLKD